MKSLVLNLTDGAERARLQLETAPVTTVTAAGNGIMEMHPVVCRCGAGKQIASMDVARYPPRNRYLFLGDELTIVGYEDGTIKLVESEIASVLVERQIHAGPVTGLAIDPSTKFSVSTSMDRTIRVLDLSNDLLSAVWFSFDHAITTMAYCRSQHRLILGDVQGSVFVLDCTDPTSLEVL